MRRNLGILLLTVFSVTVFHGVIAAQNDVEGLDTENAEVHYLSYQALSVVVDSIVERLREKSPALDSLIICGSEECKDLIQARLAFEVYEAESKELIAEYKALDSPVGELVANLKNIPRQDPETREGGVVYSQGVTLSRSVDGLTQTIGSIDGLITQSGSALTGAFSLINLIRNSTVRVESGSAEVDDGVLTTAIASRLKSGPGASNVNVYLPAYSQMANVAVADSKVLGTYRILLAHFRKAEAYNRIISLHSNLEVIPPDAETITALRTLNQKTAAFLRSLSSEPVPPEDDEPAASVPVKPDFEILEGLIIGEKFDKMLEQGSMILRVEVIKLFGSQLTKNNLILGKRVRFSGSATVRYVLTNNSGELIYANTEIYHTGFKKMKEIRP